MFLQKVEAKQETEKVIALKKTRSFKIFGKDGNHYYDIYIFPVFKTVAVYSVILCGESLWLAHSKSALLIFVI